MKKIEVKWVSRDKDGTYDIWSKEPKKTNGFYECSQSSSIICRDAQTNERFDIRLQRGGLAKIIIERQY